MVFLSQQTVFHFQNQTNVFPCSFFINMCGENKPEKQRNSPPPPPAPLGLIIEIHMYLYGSNNLPLRS